MASSPHSASRPAFSDKQGIFLSFAYCYFTFIFEYDC